MKNITELATKAEQTADLLMQDLQEINRTDAFWSLVILPEISKLADIKHRLAQIVAASGNDN